MEAERGQGTLSGDEVYIPEHIGIYVLDNPDGEHSNTICCQLYDLAVLANKPLTAEELTRFVTRSNEILTKLI